MSEGIFLLSEAQCVMRFPTTFNADQTFVLNFLSDLMDLNSLIKEIMLDSGCGTNNYFFDTEIRELFAGK